MYTPNVEPFTFLLFVIYGKKKSPVKQFWSIVDAPVSTTSKIS